MDHWFPHLWQREQIILLSISECRVVCEDFDFWLFYFDSFHHSAAPGDWDRSGRVGDQIGLSNRRTARLIPFDSRFGKLVLYKNGLCAEKDRKMVCVANHDHDVSGLSFGRFSQTACSNGYFRWNCFF